MNPREYVERYHSLRFTNPVTSLAVGGEVTEYGSGWGTEAHCNRAGIGPKAQKEYAAFARALRALHHGNVNKPCGNWFRFDQRDVPGINAAEPFYTRGLIRAFNGKGSPDEITDALRLALATGRVGSGKDAAGQVASQLVLPEYVKNYFTLDCNALVGNYHGVDPDTHISGYCASALRRRKVSEIAEGDPLVTHSASSPFEHIAMVHRASVVSEAADGTGEVIIEICEWGERGGVGTHSKALNGGQPLKVRHGPDPRLGLALNIETKPRYFFAPPDGFGDRGWGLKRDPSL